MTEGLGRRLAKYRKRLGFRSTKELAERTGGRVSESVLQNIESGRRSDLTVSQLLEIARALRIAPVLLLAPMERPLDPLDLETVGPELSGMRASDFDAWFSGTGQRTVKDIYVAGGSPASFEVQWALQVTRLLVSDVDLWRSATAELAELTDNPRRPTSRSDAQRSFLDDEERRYLSLGLDWAEGRRRSLALELNQLQERIDARVAQLEEVHADTAWLERPWLREAPSPRFDFAWAEGSGSPSADLGRAPAHVSDLSSTESAERAED